MLRHGGGGEAEKLDAAGKGSGDKLWRFPLGPAYDKLIDSQIADMKNTGPRFGGSITAATGSLAKSSVTAFGCTIGFP